MAQIRRLAEVPRVRYSTPDWWTLFSAYVGLWPVKFPFSIGLATGPFEFREASDVPTFWQIFFAQIYNVSPTDGLIIDAGANIGAFTLYALLQAPNAHVVAIEPAPDTVERLRSVVQAHGFSHRCTILQAALSGAVGTTTIQLWPNSQARVTGRGGVAVPTVTLDGLITSYGNVDLLKMDIEGAEYEALPVASPATLRRILRIEMEYHPEGDTEALFRHLTRHGFALRLANHPSCESGYGMASLTRTKQSMGAVRGEAA
jgi:FkbM family methyltransferase